MKYKEGITIVALVITIIVMIILASTITIQIVNIGDTQNTLKLVNYMKQIEAVVEKERYKKEEDSGYIYKGTLLTSSTAMNVGGQVYPSSTNIGDWYSVTTTDLENMEIELIKGNYIINYDTLKVVSVTGVKYNNVMYYALDDILQVINVE